MGTIENLTVTNWTNTGQTVLVPRWTVDVTMEWLDANSVARQHSETYFFPNVLAGIPVARLRRYMETIIMSEARLALGIDVPLLEE